MTMWAIVVKHPFAQLIAEQVKLYETRDMVPRTTVQPYDDLAIVASKFPVCSTPTHDWWSQSVAGWRTHRKVVRGRGGRVVQDSTTLVRLPDPTEIPLVFGAVICVATMGVPLEVNRDVPELTRLMDPPGAGQRCELLDDDQLAYGEYDTRRYGWPLTPVRRLATPVPVVGKQGVFALPEDVEHQVREQLPDAG